MIGWTLFGIAVFACLVIAGCASVAFSNQQLLAEDRDKARAEIERLRKSRHEARHERDQLRKEVEEARSLLDSACSEVDRLRNDLSKLGEASQRISSSAALSAASGCLRDWRGQAEVDESEGDDSGGPHPKEPAHSGQFVAHSGPFDPWIAVGDELPGDPDERVITLVGDLPVGAYYRRGVWQSVHGLPMSGVTHWARLPGREGSGVGGGLRSLERGSGLGTGGLYVGDGDSKGVGEGPQVLDPGRLPTLDPCVDGGPADSAGLGDGIDLEPGLRDEGPK